jgi:MFS transporter, SP family, arabinose:H+ symporter
LKVLQLHSTRRFAKREIEGEADEIVAASSEKASSAHFWTRRLRRPIHAGDSDCLLSINFPGSMRSFILRRASLNLPDWRAKAALLQSIGIGITNLVFTFVGLWLIDRLGRRTLLFIGSFGYIASLGSGGLGFLYGNIFLLCRFVFSLLLRRMRLGRER